MATTIQRLPLVFSLILAVLLAGACSGLTKSDKPPVTTWWLVPYTGVAKVAPHDPVTPVVLSVSVVPGLDTDRILALSAGSELKPYSGARWVDSLPELVNSLISRTLEASGRFKPDSGWTRSSSRPCDLQLELRAFYATLNSDGQTTNIHIAISGRYQCESGQPRSIDLSTSVPVHDNRMRAIVAAFQLAMDGIMQDLLQKLP